MQHDPVQRKLSGYVRLMRIPFLVEGVLRVTGYNGLTRALCQAVHPPSKSDLAQYRAAWAQPGAMTAMLNWYRALLRKPLPLDRQRRITAPTCLVWGRNDPYAVPELAESTIALCDHGALIGMKDATHWVHHDEPERVNRILLEFLK
jgi:pimeloyl-ACP methyl ester carboxylesterase